MAKIKRNILYLDQGPNKHNSNFKLNWIRIFLHFSKLYKNINFKE